MSHATLQLIVLDQIWLFLCSYAWQSFAARVGKSRVANIGTQKNDYRGHCSANDKPCGSRLHVCLSITHNGAWFSRCCHRLVALQWWAAFQQMLPSLFSIPACKEPI